MEDCVACFEFGNASGEVGEESSIAGGDAETLVDDPLCGTDDAADAHRDNSAQGSTSVAGPNTIDVDHSTNNDAHQDEGSVVESAQSNDDRSIRSSNVFFVGGALAATIGAMAAATFIVLSGGKAVFHNVSHWFLTLYFAMVDITLRIDDHLNTELPPPNHHLEKLRKRGMCWVGIGIAHGAFHALWHITSDPRRFGTAWQLKPILCQMAWTCFNLFNTRVMWQAHRDNPPNVWRFFVLTRLLLMAQQIFKTSPYPLFLAIVSGLVFLITTVGLYFLVNRLDCKIEREHVKNGYGLLFSLVGNFIPVLVLWIASFKLGNLLINSALLMLLQTAILSVVVPVSKKCFGGDDHLLWSVGIPSCILGLEVWVLGDAWQQTQSRI